MIVLIMGVSGAGKTTVGAALARSQGWDFLDADDFHPPQNVAKMAAGTPLNDADRQPWLQRLNAELLARESAGTDAVLACSALKEAYRVQLTHALRDVRQKFSARQRREAVAKKPRECSTQLRGQSNRA